MNFLNINDIEELLNSNAPAAGDLHRAWNLRQPISETPTRKTGGGTRAAVIRRIAWLQDRPDLARRITAHALEAEEFLLVCDAAEEAARLWSDADEGGRIDLVHVRMHHAAALTRLGETDAARRVLERCMDEEFRPQLSSRLRADILLQFGDILREVSLHAPAPAVRLQTAAEALGLYKRALELEPDCVRALSLTAAAEFVLDGPESSSRLEAEQRAKHVLTLVEAKEKAEGSTFELKLARAVAHAVRGETEKAREAFAALQDRTGKGAALKRGDMVRLAAARYWARFLARGLGEPLKFFDGTFPNLDVIVFSGHLPDQAGYPARFPNDKVEDVRKQIGEKLDSLQARVAVVSAAAGADLLFIDELLKRGGTVHVVLPWAREEFLETSVRPYEPAGQRAIWEPLFKRVLSEVASVRELGQWYKPKEAVGWEYMMEVTAGLALHTARASRLDVQPVALWDRRHGRGVGGTEAFVKLWRDQLGRPVDILDLPRTSSAEERLNPGEESRRCEKGTLRQEVKSMLFADIVGYSKLQEAAIPAFVSVFLERVSRLLATSKHAPCSVNTWGDAVYAVFDFTRDAGNFALELIQLVEDGKSDWHKAGLVWEERGAEGAPPEKHPLNIRVGLHAGPVFVHYNPVVRQLGFTGVHVNRAARIEPVAEHGAVFASQEFAALAELDAEIRNREAQKGNVTEDGPGFICQYAGTRPLAKGYPGMHPIYRIVPKREFAVEELAQVAHALYCEQVQAAGETPEKNASIRPWEDLPQDLQDANRAQVGDIPNKLRLLGYELSPSYGSLPSEIRISDAQVEALAEREHARWMKERERQGWTPGPRDNARKHHPLLVSWEKLSESQKDKDRDAVRNLPDLIKRANFRVRKIVGVK